MTFKDEVEKIVETLLVRPLNTPGAVAETNKLTQALTDLHESEVRQFLSMGRERLSNDPDYTLRAYLEDCEEYLDRIKALTTNTGGQE